MTSVLYNIIVAPIELVVEVVFEVLYRFVGHDTSDQVFAIIGVSLVISLLTFPLYQMADAVQKKERDIQKGMEKWTSHIRKTFKGDERFMMQQYYYKINNYSPLQSLNGSLSLILQVPFFMAAYHFLSNLEILQGTSVGPIVDLGAPDALFKIGSFSINVLPILMTIINCFSSAIYLKDFPIKDKVKTYGLAFIFLFLLYKSPSGLVVYWTCNNIFSLLKNIFYKLKNPKRVLTILCSIAGFFILIFAIARGRMSSTAKTLFTFGLFIICNIPILISMLKKLKLFEKKYEEQKKDNSEGRISDFILPGILLTIITGILIPSSVIASSPAEFVDLTNYRNPLNYLVRSICYGTGFFVFWSGFVCYILSAKGRKIFSHILWICCGVFLVDYMFFSNNLGILSSLLIYDQRNLFTTAKKFVNTFVLLGLSGFLSFLFRFKKLRFTAYLVLIIGTSVVSISQIYTAQVKLNNMSYMKEMSVNSSKKKIYKLSRTGKNVVIIMLDRAVNGYVPYILQEKQELRNQFEGFTYYPNTVSFGFWTLLGAPALYGGYEYTPTEMNKRSTETLADKHNEALMVIPVLFNNNGFDVTVCDLPHAGYKDIPDLSIFSDYPEINTHITRKVTINNDLLTDADNNAYAANERNFFFYSIFRVSPLIFSQNLYNEGNYLSSAESSVRASEFFKELSLFSLLSDLTEVTDDDKNVYLSIYSMITHEAEMLQLPDYEIRQKVDNTGLKTAADGHIKMEKEIQIENYHSHVATFIALGKWFDFMRENNVWDNTRIIIVADHGDGLGQFDYMLMKNPQIDVQACNPLFMVKDFNSKDYTVDNTFMTNADTATLSCKDLIENPVNPFTDMKISSCEKYSHPQIIVTNTVTSTSKKNLFGLENNNMLTVHDDIFKEENWSQMK
ncbi:YidC/Oxa1 family membrane protein insertase [Treponema sp.]|uniref:YidC/Oxa1 family membrane protein insertase n=1 Tax=Treponema sp. TaxID=166 RepID=UPI00388D24A0